MVPKNEPPTTVGGTAISEEPNHKFPTLSLSKTTTPSSLLTLLSSLFRHNQFSDAKSLLKHITVNPHLHRLFLHPTCSLSPPTKALLDTAVGSYVQSGRPDLVVK